MGKFTVSVCSAPARVAKKAAGEEATASSQPAARKVVPRASEVVVVEQGPQRVKQPSRLPSSAPVVVCVYLVTESAADVWPVYEGTTGVSVWQIQIEHAARPSILYDSISSWQDYLKKAHSEDDSVPGSLGELTTQCGCKLVISDASDPEGVGYVQWRAAWYVAGDSHGAVDNMLGLIDQWLAFKATQTAKEMPYEVRLHPHTGISLADDFEGAQWIVEEPSAQLPLGFFEAQPVVGKRSVTLHLEALDDEMFTVLIAGNTWNFRSRLDAIGVAGAYHEGSGNEKTYFRVMKSVDAARDRAKIFDLLDGCFKKLAVRVVVDKEPAASSACGALFTELRELPQLHFAK